MSQKMGVADFSFIYIDILTCFVVFQDWCLWEAWKAIERAAVGASAAQCSGALHTPHRACWHTHYPEQECLGKGIQAAQER